MTAHKTYAFYFDYTDIKTHLKNQIPGLDDAWLLDFAAENFVESVFTPGQYTSDPRTVEDTLGDFCVLQKTSKTWIEQVARQIEAVLFNHTGVKLEKVIKVMAVSSSKLLVVRVQV